MDSSNLRSINSGSATNDTANNSSMMVPSKRDIFLSTYRRQNFTLPESLMHYIAKNPKNAKVYQKMVKICKYFFIKNPILVLSYLYYNQNGWKTWVNNTCKFIDINRISTKLWITRELDVFPANVNNDTSLVSSIIPKIYQCDFKHLILRYQIISLNKFMFLCSSVKDLRLHRVTVKNDDGTVVFFEKLVEQIPIVKEINYTFTTPSNNISKNTFKELWKIPNLSNYDRFYLENIPEDFDIECFNSFIKKNKNARIVLIFSDEISEEYKIRLEAIIDEIIATKDHEYKPPCINFPGLAEEKYNKLCRLHFR